LTLSMSRITKVVSPTEAWKARKEGKVAASPPAAEKKGAIAPPIVAKASANASSKIAAMTSALQSGSKTSAGSPDAPSVHHVKVSADVSATLSGSGSPTSGGGEHLCGGVRPTSYKLADTNCALLGSAVEHKVKAEAAKHEPAWTGAGTEVGLRIWRINKFHVELVPEKTYGEFHTGDAYILLNTYQKDPSAPKLSHEIHFWLGMDSSTDEIGTAAYKTVELDDTLNSDAGQHREVEGKESALFLSYFEGKGGVRLLAGGYGSGFHHTVTNKLDYQPRLLCVTGDRHPRVVEIKLDGSLVNSGNVYILDAGVNLYQWTGSKASVGEKTRGAQVTSSMRDDREAHAKVQVDIFDETDAAEPFWKALGGRGTATTKKNDDEDWEKDQFKKWYVVTITSNKATFGEQTGKISKSGFDTKQMYVVDVGRHVFVWRGTGLAADAKKHAMRFGIDYLSAFSRPNFLPVSVQKEGAETALFIGVLEE